MAEQNSARREQYTRARTEFDHLAIEDKALFLIEATVSTLARGLEEAGQALAAEMDRWFHPPTERTEDEEAEPAPGTPPGAAPTTKTAAKSKAKPKRKKTDTGPTPPDESGVDEV